jgi:enoyl-CoA hydratase/carnithine racemase
MNDEPTVTTEIRGHVFLMGLNRPRKMNAFNLEMLRALSEAYTAYEHDDDLRCALLFAHGDHFTAGLDLAEVGPAVARGVSLFPEGDEEVDPLDLTGRRRAKPVVCAVQGTCLTIGVELLLASDIRLAARGATLAQMEVCRGIMPFGGATLRLPRLTGWGNGMRYLLTGERFDADEALRIGLVQEVVDPARLLDRGLEMARLVADQAPLAVRATRRAAQVAVEQGRDAALAALMDEARALFTTEDAREGVMSFIQRRKAEFTGR